MCKPPPLPESLLPCLISPQVLFVIYRESQFNYTCVPPQLGWNCKVWHSSHAELCVEEDRTAVSVLCWTLPGHTRSFCRTVKKSRSRQESEVILCYGSFNNYQSHEEPYQVPGISDPRDPGKWMGNYAVEWLASWVSEQFGVREHRFCTRTLALINWCFSKLHFAQNILELLLKHEPAV